MQPKETQKTADSQLLGKPAVLLPKTAFPSSFFFWAVPMLLAWAGAMGCFFTAFRVPLDPLPPVLMGAVCVLLCTLRFQLPRHGWRLGVPAALLWAGLVWWNFDDLREAFMRLVNLVSEAYSRQLSTPLPIFLNLEFIFPDRQQYLFTLFAALVQFPFALCLSWLLIRRKSTLGAFFLTGLLLLFPLAFSIMPEIWALGTLGLAWLFLLFCAPNFQHRRLLTEERGRFRTAGVGFRRGSTLLLLPVLALCMLLVYKLFPVEEYQFPQLGQELRTVFSRGVNLPSPFQGGNGPGGGSDRVDLAGLGERRYTGETVLRVKRDWQGEAPSSGADLLNRKKDYLKSFVGSVYTGNSWEKLDRADAREAEALLGEHRAQTLLGELSDLMSSDMFPAPPAYELSVENVAASLRCVYSPYGLTADDGLPAGTEYADDGFLRSSRLLGTESYDFSALALPGYDAMAATLSSRASALNGESTTSWIKSGSGDDVSFSIPSSALNGQPTRITIRVNGGGGDAVAFFQPESLSEDALESLSPEARSLAEAVNSYEAFVREHYTQLPDGLRAYLNGLLEEEGIRLGQQDFSETDPTYGWAALDAGRQIQDLLHQRCIYTLDPPPLPEGEDFVEFFLSESHRGYCVHFSTAAVMLYRALGIPARYAEGYAVPTRDGVWTDVPDRNAHAWVEIWLGGEGWVPVEVTPAGPDAPAAYPNARSFQNTDPPSTPGPSATPGPGENDPTPSPSPSAAPQAAQSPTPDASAAPGGPGDASGTQEGPFPARWLILPAVLLLLILLPIGGRALRLRLRAKAFAQPDRNKAALAAYAHILRLRPFVNAHLPEDPLPEGDPKLAELEDLALKARFSSHMLTQEELGSMIGFAASLEEKLQEGLPLLPRLWCRYILALF